MKYRDSSGRVTNNPYQQLINIKKYNVNFDENLNKKFSEIEIKEAQFEINWLYKYFPSIDTTNVFSYYLNFYLILNGLNIKVKEFKILTSTNLFRNGQCTLIFNRSTLNVEKTLKKFLREFDYNFVIRSNDVRKKTIIIERYYGTIFGGIDGDWIFGNYN